MKRASTFLLLGISMAAVVGCSGDAAMKTGLGDSATPEAALSRLPQDKRSGFEAWKASPVKACTLDDAFAGYNTHPIEGAPPVPRGIDGAVLAAKTGGKPLVTDASGKAAFLSDASGDLGAHDEELRVTVDDNGAPSDFHAQLSAGSSHCTITLFGQVVYDAPVFTRVNVGAIADGGAVAAARPSAHAAGAWHAGSTAQDAAVIAEASALSIVGKALEPASVESARALVAGALGVSADPITDIVTTTTETPFALQVVDAPALAWIDGRAPMMLASRSDLVKEMNGTPFTMRAYYAAAAGMLFTADLTIEPHANGDTSKPDASIDMAFTVAGVSHADAPAPSDGVANACIQSRLTAGLAARGAPGIDKLAGFVGDPLDAAGARHAPQVSWVTTACAPLASSPLADALTHADGPGAVETMIGSASYTNVVSWTEEFEGWDQLAHDEIDALLRSGANVDQALNRGGTSRILATGAEYDAELHKALAGSTLTSEQERTLTHLAYRWAMNPPSPYAVASGGWDFHVHAEDVTGVGSQLKDIATRCAGRFRDVTDAFASDATRSSEGWKGCNL